MTAQPLSSHDVFSFLQPEQVHAISNVSEVISIDAGETVFRTGDDAEFLYALLEGKVSLQLPREGGVSLHIEDPPTGALFGSCLCFDLKQYALTATCSEDSRLLKISANSLKRVMDNDLTVGYPVQRMISRTYFNRYLETMRKLQAMVLSLPIESE